MPIQTYQEIEILSLYEDAKAVEEKIIQAAENLGYNEEDVFAVRLSLEEALTNAIRHGNDEDQSKKINIRYHLNQECLDIYIADEGNGFDPTRIPDPTAIENLATPNGRGVMLMRAYMNLVEYNDTGNVLHMLKLNPNKCKIAN